MSLRRRPWTPDAVQALQDAFRAVYPSMTDEEFALEILRVAPRTLYLWRTRPKTRLREGTQQALDRTLADAPAAIQSHFRSLIPLGLNHSSQAGALVTSGPSPTAYSTNLDGALAALGSLADPSSGPAVYRPEDLAEAVLDWLTSAIGQPVTADGARVTSGNVEQVRATISALDTIERRIGGAGCRETATRYLHDVALPLLHQDVESNARTDLFSAVAELCEVVGWMYYDAGQHGVAQSYFTQALRLTREVGDDALSAYLMTSITHQALHVGEARSALRVAKAARSVAESADSPHVLVEADLLVARSHAALGQVGDATAALQRAEQSYELRESAGPRSWEPQWDDVMFASHAGTCWNDVGNTAEARRLLTHVWEASEDRPRRRIYSAAELGIAAVREGELELACQHANDIVALKGSVDSNRTREHLDRLTSRLRPFLSTRVVREFFDTNGIDANTEGATR